MFFIAITYLRTWHLKLVNYVIYLTHRSKRDTAGRKCAVGSRDDAPKSEAVTLYNRSSAEGLSKGSVSELCNLLERNAEHKANVIGIYV